MKSFITAAALLAATASADLCAHGSTDDNGNYYCQKVEAITYTGVGGAGSYNKVTSMDSVAGTCGSTPTGYSGQMSPLDGEVSMHFRGPLILKQFAVYTPSASSSKAKKARRSALERRHAHGHAHLHHARDAVAKEEKRALGDLVTAEINGKIVSWLNDYDGSADTASSTSSSAPAAKAPTYGSTSTSTVSSAPSASTYSSVPSYGSGSSSSGGWSRQAYYNAEGSTSDGLVFLNHQGGSGSGVFDYTFGNSLAYSSTDGCSGASAPTILEDCTLKSSTEVVIMSDKRCSGDSCGFSREGTVAYHGFDGPSKAFFFEFGMPDSGETAASIYDPVNMPAIWMLNAQIPRTLQYGQADCSCWTTGCGEFDIFEVLAPGDKRCKSTLHGNIAGGDSDYFERPVTGTIKAALLLYKDNIHIKIIDNSTEFGTTMPTTFLDEMVADTMEDSLDKLVSLFKLSS